MNEHGIVSIPNGEIWMSEMELADLFGTITPTVRAEIRSVYKSGVLKEYEAQKYIWLENGFYADVYSFPMVIALAFRINSHGAEQVRNILLKRMYLRKEKTNIYFSLNIGEKASLMN